MRGALAVMLLVVADAIACASAGKPVSTPERSRLQVVAVDGVGAMTREPGVTYRFKIVAIRNLAPAVRNSWQVGDILEVSGWYRLGQLHTILKPCQAAEPADVWPGRCSFREEQLLELEVVHLKRSLGLGVWTFTNADGESVSIDTGAWPP